MKIYLDDLRPTPNGWTHAYWPDEVIEYLKTGHVEIISLDHDLGDDERELVTMLCCGLKKPLQPKDSSHLKFEYIVQIVLREHAWKQEFGI